MKKYFILLLFIQNLFCVFLTTAQYKPGSLENGFLPNVVPVSPDAASLGKYGDWPVSYYTGLPSVSVPIYTIKTAGFELPISLNYHSGGIKVDEVASWVGAGFSLSAGGVISRTIVGLKDEEDRGLGGFLYRNLNNERLDNSYDLNSVDTYIFFNKVVREEIDTEPDIFFFNFAGFSGKFYFDQNGDFRSMPANSLKLVQSPINNKVWSVMVNVPWKIIDDKGNTYIFAKSTEFGEEPTNGSEVTQLQQFPIGLGVRINETEPSSWYLTHIVPVNCQDTIFFQYDRKEEFYNLPQQQSYRNIVNYRGFSSYNLPELQEDLLYNGNPTKGATNMLLSTSGKSLLKSIKWKEGELRFSANMDRQDIMGKQLKEVAVYNNLGVRQRNLTLNYSYINERYYLSSLVQADGAGASVAKHTFNYYSPEQLPKRNSSNAQDHWGYYNAKTNRSLLPWSGAFWDNQSATSVLSADREPNEQVCYYGTLQSVIFPTGGSTVFEFESNVYSGTSPIGGGNPPALIVDDFVSVNNGSGPAYFKQSTFNIQFQQFVNIRIAFSNYSRVSTKSFTWSPSVKIHTEKGIQLYHIDAFGCFGPNGTLIPGVTMETNSNGTINLTNIKELDLSAGTYTITADIATCMFLDDPVFECGPLPNASIGVRFKKYGTAPDESFIPPIGGGLRVKRIKNFDTGGTLSKTMEYEYSPGNLLIYPRYLNQYLIDLGPLAVQKPPILNPLLYACLVLDGRVREVTSTSQSILGFTQGAPVGYSRVREIEVDHTGGHKGYTNYYYSYAVDSLSEVVGRPTWANYYGSFDILNPDFPRTSFDFKNGNLVAKAVYSNYNNKHILVDSTYNTYEYNDYNKSKNYNRLRGMRVKHLKKYLYRCGTSIGGYILPVFPLYTDHFAYGFYDLISSWTVLSKSDNFRYDKNGTNPTITRTVFHYDNPRHMQLTREESESSDGVKDFLYNLYPLDYADNSGFIGDMKINHLLSYPIESVKIREKDQVKSIILGQVTTFKAGGRGALLGKYLWESIAPLNSTNFKFSNQSIGQLPMVGSYGTFQADSRYRLRAQVLLNDEYGNPREVKNKSEATTVYLWGYGGQYPIAEIKNATYADVLAVLTPATITNLNAVNVTETTVINAMNKLRTDKKLSNAMVTSYTYQPLVGMKSKTDARGVIEFYEYDGMQRLKAVLDQVENVTSSMDYHYRSN